MMRSDKLTTSGAQPQTRNELQALGAGPAGAAPAGRSLADRRHRRRLHAARAALAGIQARSHSGAVGRLRRQDGARQDRALREGRDGQQHLALLRSARRRPHRQVAPRSEDEADELRRGSPSSSSRSSRSSSAAAGARSASSTSPASSGTTTRSATRSAIGSSSAWRAAARAGAVRRPARAGARRPAVARISTRGSAATSSAS